MSSLADLTWRDAERRGAAGELLIVPLGSTEQHGPHLPLTTDTDIAVALAEGAAEALAAAVVAPAIPYGASGEHEGFPGTVSLGQEAVESMLLELGRSASATFGAIVFVSAHGGNATPLARALKRLEAEGRTAFAWTPSWRGDAHAGRVETSLMLALRPERVALDRAAAGNTAPLESLWADLRRGGVRAVAPNGVLGDPRGASAEEGRQLLATARDDLITAVSGWVGWSRPA